MENKENDLIMASTDLSKRKPKQKILKIKTDTEEKITHSDFTFTSEELKPFQPLLHNRKINFSTRTRNKKNLQLKLNKANKPVNNIEQLKKEIMELQRDDFFSYRRKMEEIQNHENEKINEYNHQNSMMIDIKGRPYNPQNNKYRRPKSTVGAFVRFSTTPLSCHSSAPRKYYSKAKKRKITQNENKEIKDTVTLSMKIPEQRRKQEEMVIRMKNVLKGGKKMARTGNVLVHNCRI